MARITVDQFMKDTTGRTFTDVARSLGPEQLGALIRFFGENNRPERMEYAELDHGRPALAGVVTELESRPEFEAILREDRVRRAVGVIVRMVMESRGWRKTGTKGSLGPPARARQKRSGPKGGRRGVSRLFRRAERYEPEGGFPY